MHTCTMMKIFFYHILKCGKNEDILKMKCWVCFLPRYKAVCPGPSSRASKQGEKSVPPRSCDLPGLWWFSGDVNGWHDSVLLCHHRCGFVGLCEAPRYPLSSRPMSGLSAMSCLSPSSCASSVPYSSSVIPKQASASSNRSHLELPW